MDEAALRKIASGRVWTGLQAGENGLADVMGGFGDAVEIAADNAGIGSDYKLRYYPQPKPLLERLTGSMEDGVRSALIKREWGEHYSWYTQWQKLKNHQGTQARMSVEFEVK
jgi:protease-4